MVKPRKVSSVSGIDAVDTQIPQKYTRTEWLVMHTRHLDSLINTVTDPTHDNMATGRVYHVCLVLFATMLDFSHRDDLMAELEQLIADKNKESKGMDYNEQMRVKSEMALKLLPKFTDYVDLSLAVSHSIGIASTGYMPDADKMDYSEFKLPEADEEDEVVIDA